MEVLIVFFCVWHGLCVCFVCAHVAIKRWKLYNLLCYCSYLLFPAGWFIIRHNYLQPLEFKLYSVDVSVYPFMRQTKQKMSFSLQLQSILKATEGTHPSIMPEVTHLASTKPQLFTVTPPPNYNATPVTSSLLATTTLLPWEDAHMQVHTILIVVIFCVVCFLLLLAFFYAFCFHCSISSTPKDSHEANRCSLEREDATYKHSSSDGQSVGNVVWLGHWTRIADVWLPISVFVGWHCCCCFSGMYGCVTVRQIFKTNSLLYWWYWFIPAQEHHFWTSVLKLQFQHLEELCTRFHVMNAIKNKCISMENCVI